MNVLVALKPWGQNFVDTDKSGRLDRSGNFATGLSPNRHFPTYKGLMLLAVIASAIAILSNRVGSTEAPNMTTSDALGANARQAMIDIFRKKDVTAVDRNFGEPFIQHDPNLADGLAGMKSFAAEIASSPAADITIYRTLVDGDLVLLHSKIPGCRPLRPNGDRVRSVPLQRRQDR